jgi:hypothetical protein
MKLNDASNGGALARDTYFEIVAGSKCYVRSIRDGVESAKHLNKDAHRLNNDYHVNLMAAFADQMFNFMSLMRGRYRPMPPNQKASREARVADPEPI